MLRSNAIGGGTSREETFAFSDMVERAERTESMLLPLQLAVSELCNPSSSSASPPPPPPPPPPHPTACARCFACLRSTCNRAVRRCRISSSEACARFIETTSICSISGSTVRFDKLLLIP